MLYKKELRTILLMWLLVLPSVTVLAQATDAKAKNIARKVMQSMGGEKAWNDTRYLSWTFNDQYQVWDKHQNRFRWEKDSLVAIIDHKLKTARYTWRERRCTIRQKRGNS